MRMFGIEHFASVINPPQAILAVGGTERRVLPKKSKAATKPQYDVGTILAVTVNCDYRVDGAEWLQVFKD
jgi:pyruvate/2-oxoglutarate dehydrogenase complex dihydrolipoamide acyltransferase (E2) component